MICILYSYVNEVVKERNPSMYALSMELETGEAPMRLAFQVRATFIE